MYLTSYQNAFIHHLINYSNKYDLQILHYVNKLLSIAPSDSRIKEQTDKLINIIKNKH